MKTKTKPKNEVPNLEGAHEYFLFPLPGSEQYFIEGLKYGPETNQEIKYTEKGKTQSINAHKIESEFEYQIILASRNNREINFYIFSRNKLTGVVKKSLEHKPLPKQNIQRAVRDKINEKKRIINKSKLLI